MAQLELMNRFRKNYSGTYFENSASLQVMWVKTKPVRILLLLPTDSHFPNYCLIGLNPHNDVFEYP